MVPSKVNYHRPSNIGEALELMSKFGDECKILAGGHSLIPVMKLRLADPENLIDIAGIADMKKISDNEKSITIGACATHADIAKNEAIQKHAPMVAKAAGMIGDVQVRNFGTIGGSIAHADPAADWPAVLLAADANVTIKNADGARTVDIDQFFKGLFMTAVEEGEILASISIPKTEFNANSTYVKMPQPASRFALVGCAVAVGGGTARVAFNGVCSTPFRDTAVEKAVAGGSSAADAAASVADGMDVMSDHFASAKYRKSMAAVYAKRALGEVM